MTRTSKPRYTAESYTYQLETTPAYWYVWDGKNSCQPRGGRRFTCQADAQAAADQLNAQIVSATTAYPQINDRDHCSHCRAAIYFERADGNWAHVLTGQRRCGGAS